MTRALRIGVILAVIVLVLGGAFVVGAWLLRPPPAQPPAELLVIGTGPDGQGVEVVAFAFVLNVDGADPKIVDVLTQVDVPGSSSKTPRAAFPFVGENGFADLVKSQTGGTALEWVSLPAESWSELAKPSGLDVEVVAPASVYMNGSLTVIEKGRQRLDSEEAVALASSIDFLEPQQGSSQLKHLSRSVSLRLSGDLSRIARLEREGAATTSLSGPRLEAFCEKR